MLSHINGRKLNATAFTNGEKVVGSSSGAFGFVQTQSVNHSATITNISIASPGVVTTSTTHNFKEGMSVDLVTTTFSIDSVAVTSTQSFIVKNPTSTTFQLYTETSSSTTNGSTPVNVTSYTNTSTVATVKHQVLVTNNNVGIYSQNEILTGQQSGATMRIQRNAYNFRAIRGYDFTDVFLWQALLLILLTFL